MPSWAESYDSLNPQDGFLVGEEDEEEGGDGEGRRRKRKRRTEPKNFELDEEDYDLLEDNQVVVSCTPVECHRCSDLECGCDLGSRAAQQLFFQLI